MIRYVEKNRAKNHALYNADFNSMNNKFSKRNSLNEAAIFPNTRVRYTPAEGPILELNLSLKALMQSNASFSVTLIRKY